MCDFSLQSIKSRPAKIGDKLDTKSFGTGTTGFRDIDDRDVAVCLLPGTEIAFERPVRLHPWALEVTKDEFNKAAHKVAIFRQFHKDIPFRHHDYLEFPGGEARPSTLLDVGQRATVLQLPATPKTDAEREEQRRAEFVG